MSYQFIQPIQGNRFDIVGDIHGEIDALNSLLHVMGYNLEGEHPEQRKLIFVGDLCDRGQNSVAVMRQVKLLMERGKAYCILGNHELNLLNESCREGNGWYFGSPHMDDQKSFNSVPATPEDQKWILQFLHTLPIALESEELRVVHACWDETSILRLKMLDHLHLREAYDHFVQQTQQQIDDVGIAEPALQEAEQYRNELTDPNSEIPWLKHLAQKEWIEQMYNPIKVVTSGAEFMTDKPIYAGGKWRMKDRLPWWEHYHDDIPVIIGHYWRKFNTAEVKAGLFQKIEPLQWFGHKQNVFCVDYSVGKRYLDRQHQREFSSKLGALRWPEKQVIFEDGSTYSTSYSA